MEKTWLEKTGPKLFSTVEVEHGYISLDLCLRGRFQPRTEFDEEEMAELSRSIKETGGNIQPVILNKQASDRYEILGGERRIRASIMAGLDNISAIYGQFSDDQCQIISVTENLQRKDLNCIEEAKGFNSLLEKGMSQKEVAGALGKSRSFIANSVRLLNLSVEVQNLLCDGYLSSAHGRTLAGIDDKIIQRDLARKTLKKKWAVRKLESEIQAYKESLKPKKKELVAPKTTDDPNIKVFEKLVSEKFGAPIAIRPSSKAKGGGLVVIAYFNQEELGRIIEKMGAWPDEDSWS